MGQYGRVLLSIPSPPISGWQIGPFFLHIYALCLIAGMIAAWMIGNRRWQARGGKPENFETIVLVAIPLLPFTRNNRILLQVVRWSAAAIASFSAIRPMSMMPNGCGKRAGSISCSRSG